MNEKNNPSAPWPHTTDCMCQKCCMPQRLPTIEELEGILREERSFERRVTAYAALTLMHALAPEWTHSVRNDKTGKQEFVVKSAGQLWVDLFGGRADLERRLARLAWELR